MPRFKSLERSGASSPEWNPPLTTGLRLLFGATIFASAFLLFQVQLILGKFLLPWFGGISSVWAACLVFFQVLLLAGYLYSHKLCSLLNVNQQASGHLIALAVATLVLLVTWFSWGSPFLPPATWKPLPGSAPISTILKLLLVSIGLSFLVLSSTAPLLQRWYSDVSSRDGNDSPYFLYALSNLASLLGLVTYPVLFEPHFGLYSQSKIWGVGFILFVFGCAVCALKTRSYSSSCSGISIRSDLIIAPVASLGTANPWLWFALPAVGSMMLLATTNKVTQDVAPIPLLWVLPLSIYLLSFVITFKKRTWYSRAIFQPLFAVTALFVLIVLFRGSDMELKQIGVFLAMLFVACVVCHGELVRIKPPPDGLTQYYLIIAAGGAAGGIFVGIVAPLIFPAIWEYHLGIWMAAVVASIALASDRRSWLRNRSVDPLVPVLLFAIIFVLPRYLTYLGLIPISDKFANIYGPAVYLVVGLLICLLLLRRRSNSQIWLVSHVFCLGIVVAALTVTLSVHLATHKGRLVYRERNFYGPISVHQEWDRDMVHSKFILMHGKIIHGIQLQKDRKLATTYYDLQSGIGHVLTSYSVRKTENLRVGVVGLGAGTIAAYGRPGDVYRFYEINPTVVRLAEGAGGYFTFVADSMAKIEVAPGDARLSLEAEAAGNDFQNFDVLVLDAFNGDSIPVHLLTREAMATYLMHLRGPDSVIAMHISNLTLDLTRPVAALAKFYGLKSGLITTSDDDGATLPSEWIVLTRGGLLNTPEIRSVAKPVLVFSISDPALWTDDYSNIIGLFDYSRISFRPRPRF
ncbi:MAG TPA: hypothetical protein VLK33_21575 [Terriglobales bacterium]|nr:hypothetical protein [Terriglobales bacterium]